jgi:lysophospholipase L1-like esterase
MLKALPFMACCALLVACGGGSPPTGPTKVPSLSRTRFLAFGDSMTSGEVTVPVGVISGLPGSGLFNPPSTGMILVPAASYPTQLLLMLQSRYVLQAPAISMTNAGKPLETAQQGVDRLPRVLAESQADVVLLLEGVNGLFIAGPDLTADFVGNMVRSATGQAKVFVASMLPTIPGRPSSQVVSEVEKFNRNVRELALAEGVVFVDLYTPLLPEVMSVIGVDGLHPTEVGYKRIAEIFYAAIQADLEVK